MATDYQKQLDELNKKLKTLEEAEFDVKAKGYVIAGFKKPLTRVQLNKEIAKINEQIPNIKAAIKTQKDFPNPVSPTGAAKLIVERNEIKSLDNKINAITKNKLTQTLSFDDAEKVASLLLQKRDIILGGYTVRGQRMDWGDKDEALKEVNDFLESTVNTLERKTDEGLFTPRYVQEGSNPNTATNRIVKDQTQEQAAQTSAREARYANIVAKAQSSTPTMESAPTGSGGQSGMNEQQTMAAYAGLANLNKPKSTKKPKVPGQPTVPGTTSTVVVDGKKVTVGSEQWKTIIQKEFGSMWDVYNSNPDVKAVIDKSVKEGWFNDELKLTASLQNTGWYRTTQQSARQFAVQQSTDPANTEARINSNVESIRAESIAQGFTLNDATLRKLATDQLKFGWSDQQRFNAIGSEVVAQSQLGGGQGMADLRQSSVARDLRSKAASYFQKPSEDMISTWTQQILTGQKSNVQWDELMRSSARTQFRSLQPALDRGEDVDTAMYAYKQQALATLGTSIDATQIDWTQDKWNKALNFRDEKTGEYRQMDLWEWNKYLRTLPEWQNTDEAKSAYGDLAMSLARGFGKTA